VVNGKSIDTSMGFTPLEGLIMGTRCGNIDPDVVTYLQEKEGLTPAQMSQVLNKKSGFLGLSCVSSDARDLNDSANEGILEPDSTTDTPNNGTIENNTTGSNSTNENSSDASASPSKAKGCFGSASLSALAVTCIIGTTLAFRKKKKF
jgi:acetate kinase